MAKKREKGLSPGRVDRKRLTAEESLKRLQEFDKRKGEFIAAVRRSKDR
jgi:hypothetical protein